MKLFILAAILVLISAASLAETPPGSAVPPTTPGTTPDVQPPPGGKASQQRAQAKAPANSCRKAAFGTCQGCSITCGSGEKAVCSDPLYSWNSNKCVRDAACRCKAKRS